MFLQLDEHFGPRQALIQTACPFTFLTFWPQLNLCVGRSLRKVVMVGKFAPRMFTLPFIQCVVIEEACGDIRV